ncbi:MAG: hypothetical protein H6606_10940 [Flavobacteriales bacterium]|nr:hypothetical protein [Flavobacteriales bacterium]
MSLRLVILAVITSLLFSTCKKDQAPQQIDPAFAGYISAFTSGMISNRSHIRVRLADSYADAEPGKKVSSKLFDFSPNIKGHAEWTDDRELVFIPEKPLPSGKEFEAEFRLSKLLDVPDHLSTLVFRFSTLKQDLRTEFTGMEAYDDQDLRWQMINAVAHTNDFAESEALEQSIEAFQNGKPLHINWEHSADGRIHNFSIDSVSRTEDRGEVYLKWNGEKLGFKGEGDEVIKVPPLGEFSVVNVKTTQHPTQSITIYFSDPIKQDQELEGLINLQPAYTLKLVRQPMAITVYPEKRIRGTVKLYVSDGIRNSLGYQLIDIYTQELEFRSIQPAVELVGDGVILPGNDGLHFPFKAVNLSAVDVKVIKIFEDNVAQFLQVNQLNGQQELKRVGRIVYKGEVPLKSDKSIDPGSWNNFALDLSKLIEVEPGAIYRVSVGFSKKHSLYPCDESQSANESEIDYPLPDSEMESYDEPGYYYDYYDYYDYEEYDYQERDNPCSASYYMSSGRTKSRNVLASDLGIIAKGGAGSTLLAAVTDLRSTEPLEGVQVEIYNFQNKLLSTQKTNSEGFTEIDLKSKPFLLVAKKDKQRGYLRLDDGSSLSLSMFDVGGQQNDRGIRGFIYGERGVWRPGDTLFLSMILEDRNRMLPENHPVLFELLSPDNQVFERRVVHPSVNNVYRLTTRTDAESQTGIWKARVKVGASVFTKNLRIEAVKPNRLKIALDFGDTYLSNSGSNYGELEVKWLHGADAPNLKCDVELKLSKHKTAFKKFPAYVFDDPSRPFSADERMIFEGNLDAAGKVRINHGIEAPENAPGMLLANFKVRAFEPGGDFSVDRLFIPYSPYRSYVGLKIPEGKGWNGALFSDEPNQIPIVCVDEKGNGVTRRNVQVEVYDVYWRWWWDGTSSEDLSQYVRNSSRHLLQSGTVDVVNGKGIYELKFKDDLYGRKFIRIVDPESGHSAGATFYVTYKGWWTNAGAESPGGAEMLTFNTDKESYTVGEKVEVTLPASVKGRTLVSIESGSKILKKFWVQASAGKFEFTSTAEMSPNAYIHLTMIQPHKNTVNDRPIRMYGVQALEVRNADSKLKPTIRMPDELKPERTFSVQVGEASNRGMTYTLAVVEEGLLDLTRFKTPDPTEHFLAKEALSVRTWDMYKFVIGAQSGAMAGLLALGGDEYLGKQEGNQANRFKPVVRFLGPFYLKPGTTATHRIDMPNYIGSVRTMVVASNPGAYGSAEKATPVRTPLMLLSTLPRVLGPEEEVSLPVTIFAMNPAIRDVQISVKTNSLLQVDGSANKAIRFEKTGEKVVYFKLKTADLLGKATVTVSAQSGNERSSYPVELQVRAPNPLISDLAQWRLEPGESVEVDYQPLGIKGTNKGTLEASALPPLLIEKRLDYLIQYPHGCLEQTTSSVFPQLFVDQFTELSTEQKQKIQEHVDAALDKLRRFQMSNGGFSYWPGNDHYSDWATTYVGHFLLEARARGYKLPPSMLENWVQFQKDKANTWVQVPSKRSDLLQAYRLYSLALAGEPALGAMNRLRSSGDLGTAATWRLAAAYQLSGRGHVATELVRGQALDVNEYTEWSHSFGSRSRDRAMILETLSLMKRKADADKVFELVSHDLGTDRWYSTQQTAFMLVGISKYLSSYKSGEPIKFALTRGGKRSDLTVSSVLHKIRLKPESAEKLTVKNTGSNTIFLTQTRSGIPGTDSRPSVRKNLEMSVIYTDLNGRRLDIDGLPQGTDFYAEVTLRNPGVLGYYENLSLSQIFPSGWEIRNFRMDAPEDGEQTTKNVDYQDIRDDRVLSYLNLNKGKTVRVKIQLHAAYRGRFYAPSVYAEAMYDDQIRALEPGKWIRVTEPGSM